MKYIHAWYMPYTHGGSYIDTIVYCNNIDFDIPLLKISVLSRVRGGVPEPLWWGYGCVFVIKVWEPLK